MEDLNCWQSKFESCLYSDKLINKIILLNNKKTNYKINLYEIKKAIFYCKKYHATQKRLSGEPYYSHPLAVAELVAPYCFNSDILVTSILHDTLEDTILTKNMLELLFNTNVSEQVEALTRIKIDRKLPVPELIENLCSLKNCYELLIVKFFDRIHNMQTIDYKPAATISKTVEETFKTFMAIGIYLSSKNPAFLQYEQQMTDLCYRHMQLKQSLPLNAENIFEDSVPLPFPTFQNG